MGTRSVRIFCSYAHDDKEWMERLINNVTRGHDHIELWYDNMISPGKTWSEEIERNLNNADIILLLISDRFLASKYCNEVEVPIAMRRYRAKEKVHVIPIILRPTHWQFTKFSRLQALPAGGKAITSWDPMEEAFVNIAAKLHAIIDDDLKEFYISDARTCWEAKQFEEAREICESALRNSYVDPALNEELGDLFHELKCFDQALEAYDKAIEGSKDNKKKGLIYAKKGQVYAKKGDDILSWQLKSDASPTIYEEALIAYEEALIAYEEALEFDRSNILLYEKKADVLLKLGRFQDALDILDTYTYGEEAIKSKLLNRKELLRRTIELHEKKSDIYATFIMINIEKMIKENDIAIELDPTNSALWSSKGQNLTKIGQLENALEVYHDAIKRFCADPYLHKERGDVLYRLKCLPEALADYEKAISLLSSSEVTEETTTLVIERIKGQIKIVSDNLLQRKSQDYKQDKEKDFPGGNL